jgi:co-chaperonin GroES (HSP10)
MIKPLGDRILLKDHMSGDVKIGSLYVPETCQRASEVATVLEVGPDVTCCTKGDYVVFDRYGGTLLGKGVTQENAQQRIVSEDHIFMTLKEPSVES